MGEIADMGVIYRIDCAANGRFYIGSSVQFPRRKSLHLRSLRRGDHHSAHMQRSFKRYGENAFSFTIIEEGVPLASLAAREGYHIRILKPLFNGSRISATRLGVPHSEATKARIALALTGKKMILSPFGIATRQAQARKMHEARRGTKMVMSPSNLASKQAAGRKLGLSMRGRKLKLTAPGLVARQTQARRIAGPNQHARKVTPEIWSAIERLVTEGLGSYRIAKRLGLSKKTIINVRHGRYPIKEADNARRD